ncbi:hypothetical protein CG709_14980, partial [Lachnotalea glycerini]
VILMVNIVKESDFMEYEKLRKWLICTLIISLIAISVYYVYFLNSETTITDGTLVKNQIWEVGMIYE